MLPTEEENVGSFVIQEKHYYPETIHYEELPHWQTHAPVSMVGQTQGQLTEALVRMENSINYGQKAKLQLITSQMPTRADLDTFHAQLITSGFHTSKPVARSVQGFPCTELVIQKGSPTWAALIPILPTIFIVGLVTFGLVKLETITKAIMPILLVSVGGLIILAAVITRQGARPLREVVGTKYLPATIPVSAKKAPAASYR